MCWSSNHQGLAGLLWNPAFFHRKQSRLHFIMSADFSVLSTVGIVVHWKTQLVHLQNLECQIFSQLIAN